jgi:CRP-like cAMP-binding protein
MNRPGRPGVHPAKAQFLGGFGKQQLRTVAQLGTPFDRDPGIVLTREGQPGFEFIIILEGAVEVRTGDRVVATRGPGDCLGEISLLGSRPQTATAVSTTPVLVDVLSKREFWSLLYELPALSDQLHATMSERLVELAAPVQPLVRAS